MSKLTLEVDVDGAPGDIDVLVGALAPEHAEAFPGVATRLERNGDRSARLVVHGDHVPNVRAAANAHLRWIRTVEDVLDVGPDATTDEVV